MAERKEATFYTLRMNYNQAFKAQLLSEHQSQKQQLYITWFPIKYGIKRDAV